MLKKIEHFMVFNFVGGFYGCTEPRDARWHPGVTPSEIT